MALEWKAGEISDPVARQRIAELIFRADVLRQVACEIQTTPQRRLDLIEDLEQVITHKILDPEANGLQIQRLQTASACGWARQLARSATTSLLRNRYGAKGSRLMLFAPRELSTAGQPHADAVNRKINDMLDTLAAETDNELITADDPDERNHVENVLDKYTNAARYTRGADRIRHQVAAITEGLRLEPATRLDRRADRDHILSIIRNDQRAARRSLEAFVAVVFDGEDPDDVEPVEPLLMCVWDDQTPASARRILELWPDIVTLIVEGANAARSRPSEQLARTFKRTIRRMIPADATWREISEVLGDCYLASECEPYNAFAPLTETQRKAREKASIISRSRTDATLQWASDFPGSPLGATGERIWARLTRTFDDLLEDSQTPATDADAA